jgi:N-acetylmuramoyl-L-alanine amidase
VPSPHRPAPSVARQRVTAAAVLAVLLVVLVVVEMTKPTASPRAGASAVDVRRPAPTTPRSSTATTTAVTSPTATVTATASSTAAPHEDPEGPLAALAGKVVTIDPGHNGGNFTNPELISRPIDIGTQTRACDTTGTATDDGYTEAEYTLDVGDRLAAILRTAGATVVLTRTSNDGWGPCIDERARIGNDAHSAVALSIHADGGPADGRGFHVLYPPSIAGLTDAIASDSLRLAHDIRDAYREGTGTSYATYIGDGNGMMARTDLGGLNLSTVPKVFIETGNMRNAADAALLETPSFRQTVAQSLAEGLARYLAGR